MTSKIKNLINNQGIRRYGINTIWLLGERVLRIFAGLLVGIWVARYLGPSQFGIFSYVLAFVGLFAPLAKLGMDGIISRDVAREETDLNQLLSSSFLMKLLGALFVVFFTTGYMIFTKNDPIYTYLAIVLSFVFVVKSFEVLEFYFRAKVKGIYISVANSVGIIVVSLLKIIFILSSFPLIYFAIANLIEVLVAILLLLFFFRRETVFLSSSFATVRQGRRLLKESWPLIFSGFFALVYLNIDQIMIEEMLGSYEVGQYSAASRISSALYFIPMTIGWSIQTIVVNAKKSCESLYYQRIQELFSLLVVVAYILIIPIYIFSEPIVLFLFGSEYRDAVEVLALHIWASLFVFVGLIRGLWVLNESYFKFALMANLGAGAVNIVLNYYWLPIFGIIGAAWATLISYGVTYFISGFFFKPARKVAIMQLKSIILYDVFKQFRRLG